MRGDRNRNVEGREGKKRYFDKRDDKWKQTGGRKIRAGAAAFRRREEGEIFPEILTLSITGVSPLLMHEPSIRLAAAAATLIIFTDKSRCSAERKHVFLEVIGGVRGNARSEKRRFHRRR